MSYEMGLSLDTEWSAQWNAWLHGHVAFSWRPLDLSGGREWVLGSCLIPSFSVRHFDLMTNIVIPNQKPSEKQSKWAGHSDICLSFPHNQPIKPSGYVKDSLSAVSNHIQYFFIITLKLNNFKRTLQTEWMEMNLNSIYESFTVGGVGIMINIGIFSFPIILQIKFLKVKLASFLFFQNWAPVHSLEMGLGTLIRLTTDCSIVIFYFLLFRRKSRKEMGSLPKKQSLALK